MPRRIDAEPCKPEPPAGQAADRERALAGKETEAGGEPPLALVDPIGGLEQHIGADDGGRDQGWFQKARESAIRRAARQPGRAVQRKR